MPHTVVRFTDLNNQITNGNPTHGQMVGRIRGLLGVGALDNSVTAVFDTPSNGLVTITDPNREPKAIKAIVT